MSMITKIKLTIKDEKKTYIQDGYLELELRKDEERERIKQHELELRQVEMSTTNNSNSNNVVKKNSVMLHSII